MPFYLSRFVEYLGKVLIWFLFAKWGMVAKSEIRIREKNKLLVSTST